MKSSACMEDPCIIQNVFSV
uniref:Uncharacterized protein n=1 Tax=Anopheles albimanus TaxID=7167 RepID=A0A182FZ46_ANOAL